MKNIILILVSTILLNSCNFDTQDTRLGQIVPNLSKTNQIAISDGKDIFLITPDSVINDSLKLKIIFATKKVITDPDLVSKPDTNYHHNLFTVYKSGILPGMRGPDSYYNYVSDGHYNYVSDGQNSIGLEFRTPTLINGEQVVVIYRGDVTTPTYKVIK